MAMGHKSGARAGLPAILRGTPRLNAARATAANNRRRRLQLIELVFAISQTWSVPPGVKSIAKLTGRGGAGSPEVDGEEGLLERKVVKIFQSGVLQSTDTTYKTYPNYSAPKPDDQCFNESDSSGYRKETCYYHSFYDNDEPATTGANATGFGKTFPGGYAGPATPVEYLALPTTPGTDVSLIIPVGGYIRIVFLAR